MVGIKLLTPCKLITANYLGTVGNDVRSIASEIWACGIDLVGVLSSKAISISSIQILQKRRG